MGADTTELAAGDVGQVAPLLGPFGDRFPLQALADGSLGGRLFVNSRERPTAAFAWTEVGYYYLAGDSDDACFAQALGRLLADELIPAAKALGETMPVFYLHPLAWEQHLGTLTGGRDTLRVYRRRFRFDPGRFGEARRRAPELPPELRIERVQTDRGPQVRVLCEGETVAECGAALRVGRKREIGIYTAETYRRQGLATAAGAAFVEYCLAHGLEPCWECFWDNAASCQLAHRLGFCEPTDYPVWAWRLP